MILCRFLFDKTLELCRIEIVDHTEESEMTTAEIIEELMNRYDETRQEWINWTGSDEGSNEWFTEQVMKAEK